MKLSAPDYVVLVVEELDRALTFYVGVLGLELQHRSGAFAQLATGATRLALFERHAMQSTLGVPIRAPELDAPAFELGFKVVDIDSAFAELIARGVPAVAAPTDRAWGQRTAYLRDPDGHLIELAEDRRTPR